jgi:hypothetical protein
VLKRGIPVAVERRTSRLRRLFLSPWCLPGMKKRIILCTNSDRMEEWKSDHVIGLTENFGMQSGSSWILI